MKCYLRVQAGKEEELLSLVKKYGYKEAVLVYSSAEKTTITSEQKKKLEKDFSVTLLLAIDCKTPKDAKKKGFDEFLQLGTRKKDFFPGITHVYGNETEPEKDFMHQRRSGLNHILLAEAQKKGITVLLDFSVLSPQILGRMQQNVKLCRKAKVNCAAAVFISRQENFVGAADVQALRRLLE